SVVVTYRGSGMINLAAGAVAMLAGYAFWGLRTGEYEVVLSPVPAVVATLLFSLLVGVVFELCAVRPLRSATPLAKLVASLGVLLICQALVLLIFGNDPQSVETILPRTTVHMLGVDVPTQNFIMAGLVIAIAAGLAITYRWTGFGLAT